MKKEKFYYLHLDIFNCRNCEFNLVKECCSKDYGICNHEESKKYDVCKNWELGFSSYQIMQEKHGSRYAQIFLNSSIINLENGEVEVR